MAGLTDVVKSMLQNDAALAALLTGGVFDADDFEHDEGGSNQAPRDPADPTGVKILPFAYIHWRNSNAYQTDGANALGAELGAVEVYNYQDTGHAVIRQALKREKAVLHDQYLTADDQKIAHVLFAGTVDEAPDDKLGRDACGFIRFQIVHIRN